MGWVLVDPLGQAWDVHLVCDCTALSLLPDLHGMMGLASHTLPFMVDRYFQSSTWDKPFSPRAVYAGGLSCGWKPN